jgi:hypothetical protein
MDPQLVELKSLDLPVFPRVRARHRLPGCELAAMRRRGFRFNRSPKAATTCLSRWTERPTTATRHDLSQAARLKLTPRLATAERLQRTIGLGGSRSPTSAP